MRPLELRLAHFGPYRGEAVLDFTALDRLFLVCGPTGAGKTTLFDALTYALYEKTPGTRGGLTDQLASHHAPEGSVPSVSLRFSLGAQQWRVQRQLRHRVRKQRGDGWTERDAQVLLEKRTDSGWEPVAGKRSEINQKLEDMLGLSAEEFAKIVVLPQGDFQRFLEASSGDREKMLQKLFPVEVYDRLAEEVKNRARAAEDNRRRIEDRWQELTAQTGPGTGERETLETAHAEAVQAARDAADQENAAAAEVVRLQGLAADWSALNAKRAERQALEQRRTAYETDKTRLDRARQARPWSADLDRQTRLLTEGRTLRTAQDGLKAQRAETESTLAAAAARGPEARARESRLEEVLQQKGLLDHQKTLWNEARGLAEAEGRARAAEDAAQGRWNQAQAERQAREQALPPDPEGADLAQAYAAAEEAREADRRAQDQERQRRTRSAAEEVRSRAAGSLEEARTREEAAEAEARLWTEVSEALKAAALSDALAEGQPCPVCGSTSHPRPARRPQAAARAPERLEAALRNRDEAREARAAAQASLDASDAALAALAPPDGTAADPGLTGRALADALTRIEDLQAAEKRRKAAQEALNRALESERTAQESYLKAAGERESWSARVRALTGSVTEDPTPRSQALAEEEATLRRKIDEDRRLTEALNRTLQGLEVRIEEQEVQLMAQREEYRRLQTGLEEAAAGLGWSLDDLRAARLDDQALGSLEAATAAFEREHHRLEGEIGALESRFPAGAPEAPGPMEKKLTDLRQARAEADLLVRDREFQLRERDKIEDQLRETSRRREEGEAEFQFLVPLAKALDGRNEKNLKLTTWILVQALEQVAESAGHRLRSMSGGRYGLKVQGRGSDGRRDWGLDLAVIDSYTGQERAVGTLSGGEKFMTSISLALGLADVIQERSGGLKLEAIFIDEGFGTLDDQSLDRAMAILHDLGQHRSVGIISHVAELRQRITSRVEVVKGREGSTLRLG